ncbi:MAG: hypothetical protein BWY45_03463 [Euryarchaeota archaeon ADurb.Bin294]|nr:MAG: hypothetical protein BWY45_03463 [Euryarchaeota archaeon ADurb.Bin294]
MSTLTRFRISCLVILESRASFLLASRNDSLSVAASLKVSSRSLFRSSNSISACFLLVISSMMPLNVRKSPSLTGIELPWNQITSPVGLINRPSNSQGFSSLTASAIDRRNASRSRSSTQVVNRSKNVSKSMVIPRMSSARVLTYRRPISPDGCA